MGAKFDGSAAIHTATDSGGFPENPEAEFRPVIQAFHRNNFRWQAHRVLIYLAASRGMNYEKSVRQLFWKKHAKPYLVGELDSAYDDEVKGEIGDDSGFYDGDKESLPMNWGTVFQDRGDIIQELFDDAVGIMFEAQIVSAWTMFETLASDLWVAAVNACPDPLAKMTGKVHRIKTKISEQDDDVDAKANTKKFTISEIIGMAEKPDFSMSIGALLKKTERVKFINLRAIRQAYASAFDEKGSVSVVEIDSALSPVALDELALIRNMIVHSAGKADQAYVEGQKFVAGAPKLEIGAKPELDAGSVLKIIDPVVGCSTSLIGAVDKWLKTTRAGKPAD